MKKSLLSLFMLISFVDMNADVKLETSYSCVFSDELLTVRCNGVKFEYLAEESAVKPKDLREFYRFVKRNGNTTDCTTKTDAGGKGPVIWCQDLGLAYIKAKSISKQVASALPEKVNLKLAFKSSTGEQSDIATEYRCEGENSHGDSDYIVLYYIYEIVIVLFNKTYQNNNDDKIYEWRNFYNKRYHSYASDKFKFLAKTIDSKTVINDRVYNCEKQ